MYHKIVNLHVSYIFSIKVILVKNKSYKLNLFLFCFKGSAKNLPSACTSVMEPSLVSFENKNNYFN